MHEMTEETIILTFDEMRILLCSMGFTSCEGIYMPDREYTAGEVIRTLHALSIRGIMTAVEEECRDRNDRIGETRETVSCTTAPAVYDNPGYRMRKDVQRMILTIGNPAGTFIFRPGDHLPGFVQELYNGKEYYCYIVPDYVVITERDWTRRESIRVRGMDTDSFSQWREDCERAVLEERINYEGMDENLSKGNNKISEDKDGTSGFPSGETETLSAIL